MLRTKRPLQLRTFASSVVLLVLFVVIIAVISCCVSAAPSHHTEFISHPWMRRRTASVGNNPSIRIGRRRHQPGTMLALRSGGRGGGADAALRPSVDRYNQYGPPTSPSPPVVLSGTVLLRHHHHQRPQIRPRRHGQPCQHPDISLKAYLADTVVVGRAESMSSDRRDNYTVLFKILRRIKNHASFPLIADHVPLRFATAAATIHTNLTGGSVGSAVSGWNCEPMPAIMTASARTQQPFVALSTPLLNPTLGSTQQLVTARIEKSREYMLFLHTNGAHNYTVVAAPEPRRRSRIPNAVLRVINPAFKPKEVRIDRFERIQNAATQSRGIRLKLVCKVKGFPIPYIFWRKNGTYLHSNSHIRITYKKRKSTLVIKSPVAGDWGHYECISRGIDGSQATRHLRVEDEYKATSFLPPASTTNQIRIDVHCKEEMNRNYCSNGGTCFYLPSLDEYACICAEGYSGNRCESKSSNQSRY